MSTPQATPSGAGFGFSFMDLFTPKTAAPISFGDQPNQSDVDSDEAARKKSGLEAYARRNKQALPKDFSDQVIENEMDLEKDFVTLETVNKLTELYSLAMAFYESEGNHKYKYFANKLQDLLMKANVKEMMVRELAPSKKTKQDEQQIKRLRLENKISKINAEKEAFTVVKSQEYRDRELNKVLEKNIQSQKDRIKQRLAEKKARAVSRAQSVTYLSDDNSSLPDENMKDLEKELEDKPRLNDIAEVDEARYNTPPRKRGKDGQMIFFEKGKAQKTFKFDFDEDKKNPPVKGHTRRHSFHRENVVAVIAQKRTSRAQSFGNGKAPFPLEKLKPLTDDNNKAITEKIDAEEHSAGFARKQTKNQTIVEDCNEDKNKSVNSIESAASKNQVEEIVVQDEREPEHTQNVESAVFLDDDDDDHEHEEQTEETQVVAEEEEVQEVQVEEQENTQPEAEEEQVIEGEQTQVVAEQVQEVQVEEQENTQPEAEEEQIIETEETQPVTEETQVVPEKENIHEPVQEVQEVQDVQVEQENTQPEAEEEQVVEGEQTQVVAEEETISEQVQEVQVEEQENTQTQAETEVQVEAVVSEVQQEEPVKEEATESAPEQIVEETEQVPEMQEEQVQTEVKEEQVQNEEPKVETEEVKEQIEEEVTEEKAENVEEVVEQVKEEKNIRRRTDSEVADEKKLALMRQIDAEQKELIDAFIQKQAQEREEVTKKIEEKFEQKIQNMKEDMDEDEIAGDMWQRALKKFNKDKETEINESLEKLGQEQAPEFDKYKKKLLQQKMFKLAELSDE